MGGRPHMRFRTVSRQLSIAQEFVTDHETALSPLRHAGLRDQFVAIGGWNDISSLRRHQRDADNPVSLEQFPQRQACRTKKSGRALVKPPEIIRKENNLSGITIPEFDPDANAIDKHS